MNLPRCYSTRVCGASHGLFLLWWEERELQKVYKHSSLFGNGLLTNNYIHFSSNQDKCLCNIEASSHWLVMLLALHRPRGTHLISSFSFVLLRNVEILLSFSICFWLPTVAIEVNSTPKLNDTRLVYWNLQVFMSFCKPINRHHSTITLKLWL